MVGLQYLFLEPNADDPLNKGICHLNYLLTKQVTRPFRVEAAEDLRRSRENFTHNVKNSLRGGVIKGVGYDNVAQR